MTTAASTTTFKGKTFTISEVLPVAPLLAREGITKQEVITGAKGATFLLQTWEDGTRRTISTSGRAQTEYPAAA